MQFSEEMASLSDRFRQIEITVASPSAAPAAWPEAWLSVEQSAAVFRFVDTQFEKDRSMAEIRRLFTNVQHIAVNAMPLRAIFVTLAKARRKAA